MRKIPRGNTKETKSKTPENSLVNDPSDVIEFFNRSPGVPQDLTNDVTTGSGDLFDLLCDMATALENIPLSDLLDLSEEINYVHFLPLYKPPGKK